MNVNAVEIPFTVKDSQGHLVPGLTWRDVHVYENHVRQHATVFTVDPNPLSVAIVIDQTLSYHDMTRVNNALGALQSAFTPYDEVAIVTYNNGSNLVTDFTGGQSTRLAGAILKARAPGREEVYYDTSGPLGHTVYINDGADRNITPQSAGGVGSPQGFSQQVARREAHQLNDAILTAAKVVAKAGKGRRRIVYVISDGKEYKSQSTTKEVIRYLQTNKIQVMATLVGDSSVKGMGFIEQVHLPFSMRDNALPVYTKATGGEFYADYRTSAIEASFQKITDEARNQYTIWYNSTEPLDDEKYRRVEVRVLRPNLQVIAKDGYFPSPQDATPRPVSGNVAPPQ